MVLRISSPLLLFVLFVWISMIQAALIRERKSTRDNMDIDLYDDPLADKAYERMTSLCARLRKRANSSKMGDEYEQRQRKSPAPLVMRLCDLLA